MSVENIDKCEKTSVIKAFANMLRHGLDYTKSQCYFFVQDDKYSPTGKSLRFGWQYQGLVKVAKERLGVKKVCPVLVYEGDDFSVHYELGELIIDRHVPGLDCKDALKGGYCVVHSDEGCIVRYLEKSEIDKRSGCAKSGKFWVNWTREMQEKTLVNATLKRLIEQSGEIDNDDLYGDEGTEHAGGGFRAPVLQSPQPADVSVPEDVSGEAERRVLQKTKIMEL